MTRPPPPPPTMLPRVQMCDSIFHLDHCEKGQGFFFIPAQIVIQLNLRYRSPSNWDQFYLQRLHFPFLE